LTVSEHIDDQPDLHRAIARIARDAFADHDWDAIRIHFRETGRASSARVELLHGQSWHHERIRSVPLMDAFHELRRAMSAPEQGAWMSYDWHLDRAGTVRGTANWDRRVWNTSGDPFTQPDVANPMPSDEMWALDLEQYPRSPAYMPEWLASIVSRRGH
jgi:hypothetical protein